MFCKWFPVKVYCFHECLLTQFWLFALNIRVCTDTEHQGNRYPAARNSVSPPETFTQQLNTPGTVTILQGDIAVSQPPHAITPYVFKECSYRWPDGVQKDDVHRGTGYGHPATHMVSDIMGFSGV